MLLVRLRKILNIDKVTRISFAEYLSKRNYVERVHAVENNLLSAHGPFNSKQVHAVCEAGSEEHKANMEKMAEDVVTCLNKGSFGEKPLMCFRGIADQMLFDNEDVLKTFAALSDYRKKTYDITYAPVNNDIMNYLEKVWGTKKGFVGSYSSDYETLQKYSYCDKYSTTVYRDDENWLGKILPRYERQPIPDYHKWIISGEYHYLSYEQRRDLPHGPWDNCPELFLPERIINACFRAFPNPTSDMIKFTKEELILKCVQKKLEPTGNKVDLVKRLSKVHPFEELESNPKLYNGDLKSVPGTISGLNQLNVAHLREILRHHGILEDGVKEELVFRVGLLKGGAEKACFSKERISIIQAISFAEELFSAVEALSTERVCRVREYSRCDAAHYRTRDTPLLSVFQRQIKSLE